MVIVNFEELIEFAWTPYLIKKWDLLFQFSLSSEYENFTFTFALLKIKGQTESYLIW